MGKGVCIYYAKTVCMIIQKVAMSKYDMFHSRSAVYTSVFGRFPHSLLSLFPFRLNFAPAPVRIPTAHIVASVKAAIGQAKPSEKLAAKARMNVIGAIHQAKIPPRNISHKEMRALKDIANDEKILVLPADKGKATVVMDKADYDDKMQQMLSDEGTYKPLDRDPTVSLERRMNSRLLDLRKAGQLHPDTYSWLRSSASRVPLLYGRPKVHKPGAPLRPIVLFVSSPMYELSKFLAGLLSPIAD